MSMMDGEYDDDYDDQYDDVFSVRVGDKVAGDYGMVQQYNKMARESEKEAGFWEEMRNTNKKKERRIFDGSNGDNEGDGDSSDSGDDGISKKNFGADKGKGGRIIGPDGKFLPHAKGGKKKKKQMRSGGDHDRKAPGDNVVENSGGNGLTDRQKKKKGINKAAKGNHHRKDRSLRKTGGF